MTTNYIPSSVATKGVKPGGARGAYAPRLFLLRPEIILSRVVHFFIS